MSQLTSKVVYAVFFSQRSFIRNITGWYKMQTTDCRLGLKCRLRPKLSHRLMIRDMFSIYDVCIGKKKIKSNPFNGRSQKVEMF